ncbi:MAG: hypothetical protein ACI381_06650 [Candidatus Methanomethylophilaceae archaeon]
MQATSAGEAVLLGEDGLIPASLLPNTGWGTWEQISYDSTLVSGDIYMAISPSGMSIFIAYAKSSEQYVYFPGDASAYICIKDYVVNKLTLVTSNSITLSSETIRLYHLVE